MDGLNLYFFAILLPPAITQRVRDYQLEMKEQFGPKRALERNIPHITLQAPFKRTRAFEEEAKQRISAFAQAHPCFDIELKNFGSFAKHTIYIDVPDKKAYRELQVPLARLLRERFGFEELEAQPAGHPHVTIAYRDLKPVFTEAWKYFAPKHYSASFTVESFHLLRHNGQSWQPIQEYPLNKAQQGSLF